jgi:hypothetical protein
MFYNSKILSDQDYSVYVNPKHVVIQRYVLCLLKCRILQRSWRYSISERNQALNSHSSGKTKGA